MLKQADTTDGMSIETCRLTTHESLATLREQLVARRNAYPRQIIVSSGSCGQERGSLAVVSALREELSRQGLADEVMLRVTGCHGFCKQEPMAVINPGNLFYCHLQPKDAAEIVSQTVAHGKVIDRLLYFDPSSGERIRNQTAVPFYAAQDRTLLDQGMLLDPRSIDDAIANGGYAALARVLAYADPKHVIEEIKRSGLRRPESAGLFIGSAWEHARTVTDDRRRSVTCIADVSDPAAHVDRTILESNPHAVLEGMILGAYAIGACVGRVRLRDEHRLASQHMQLAIEAAREYGLLGDNILNSGFSFDVDIAARTCEPPIKRSSDAEPARHRKIEPEFQNGSCHLESAETWANVSRIIHNGAAWYADWGFGECTGTKILSLSGPIENNGFVEVPMGMSLRTIVLDIGGGIRNGGKLKAVQTGGPSGGCLPVRKFNLTIDYETLAKAGSIVGSGGIVAMGCETCMVDVAKRSLEFLAEEACGQCEACQKTIGPMLEILTDIVEGRGHPDQPAQLKKLGRSDHKTPSCPLGKTAANPVLSTLMYFRNEYDAHIQDGRCPAGVCRALVHQPSPEKMCDNV